MATDDFTAAAAAARRVYEAAGEAARAVHERIWNQLACCERHALLAQRARQMARQLRTSAAFAASRAQGIAGQGRGFVGARGSPGLAEDMLSEAGRLEQVAAAHDRRSAGRQQTIGELRREARASAERTAETAAGTAAGTAAAPGRRVPRISK